MGFGGLFVFGGRHQQRVRQRAVQGPAEFRDRLVLGPAARRSSSAAGTGESLMHISTFVTPSAQRNETEIKLKQNIVETRRPNLPPAQLVAGNCDWLKRLKRFTAGAFCLG